MAHPLLRVARDIHTKELGICLYLTVESLVHEYEFSKLSLAMQLQGEVLMLTEKLEKQEE
jgi:hypothetical protein